MSFMIRSLEIQAANRSLKELAIGGAPGLDLICQAQERISPVVEELVTRAQKAGLLRPGVGTADFALVPIMISAIIDSARAVDPDLWRRTLALVMDGFRGQNCPALPGATPSLDEMARIKNDWRPPSTARPRSPLPRGHPQLSDLSRGSRPRLSRRRARSRSPAVPASCAFRAPFAGGISDFWRRQR